MTDKPELAWNLADYEARNVEPPQHLISSPHLTEGLIMTDDEIEEFIKDSIATLRILTDHNSPRATAVFAAYKGDLGYLVEIGRLSESDYNDLTHPDNLLF